MDNDRYYIYAVTRDGTPLPQGITGIQSQPVELITAGSLAACVSRLGGGRLRPQRANLAAHQDVIRRLTECGEVLPVSFGMVAESKPLLGQMLDAHAETLAQELERVGGCGEMGLRVSWNVENIFEMFVSEHEDLRRLASHVAREGQSASRDLLMEVGKTFERFLEAERAECLATLLAHLDGAYDEHAVNTPKSEREVLDLAFLVRRDRIDAYESALLVAAEHFDDRFTFDVSGPWAPHHFVSLQLSLAA